MTDEKIYYIHWDHRIDQIVNSEMELIGKSRLYLPFFFFGKSYVKLEIGFSKVYKCFFSNILSSEMKVYESNALIFSFVVLKTKPFTYALQFQGKLLEYIEVVNQQHYEVVLAGNKIGRILYYPKISGEVLSSGFGTQINIPIKWSIPTIIFALLKKDHYGPST